MVSEKEAGRADGGGRRSREEARSEILEAAERFLRERPLRELTVGDLMDRTSIGRSAFYVYFEDRYRLVAALLARLETDFLEAAASWLSDPSKPDPFPRLRQALEATVAVWAEHGPVLRAIAEAAAQDHDVEQAYRWGLLERFIVAIADRIETGRALGRIGDLDARETATALILMNERYLADRFGKSPQIDSQQAVDTLYTIWSATLYGGRQRNLGGSDS